jgi:hypothetical protein
MPVGWLIVLASILPVSASAVKDKVEAVFQSASARVVFIRDAALLVSVKFWANARAHWDYQWLDALWIGIGSFYRFFPVFRAPGSTIAFVCPQPGTPGRRRFSFSDVDSSHVGAACWGKRFAGVPNLPDFCRLSWSDF